jgi:hypothetical protein
MYLLRQQLRQVVAAILPLIQLLRWPRPLHLGMVNEIPPKAHLCSYFQSTQKVMHDLLIISQLLEENHVKIY